MTIDVTALGAVIAAIGGLGGFIGVFFSRRKTKAEAESIVVSGAETVARMWQTYSMELQGELTALREELKTERNMRRQLAVRYLRLERAITAAGLDLPEDTNGLVD